MELSARPRERADIGVDDAGVLAASFMLVAAALVHLALTPEHFAQWWLFGVLFCVAAALQAVLAVAVLRRPTRRVSAWVCAISAGIVGVWVLSRTSGLPFGPQAGMAERVGWLDLVTNLDELLLIGLLATQSGWMPWRSTGLAPRLCQACGAAVALLLTLAFAGGVGHG